MATKNEVLRKLFARAEAKYGFRFACELHEALLHGKAENVKVLVRRVLA